MIAALGSSTTPPETSDTMRTAKPVCRSACALLLWSCAAHPGDPPLITDPEEIAAHDGQLVTLRGTLHSIKWSTVLGVCVNGEPGSLDGALVEVTGVLSRKNVPAPASVWDSETRPYGTYFVLLDPHAWRPLAKVRLLRPKETHLPAGTPKGDGD